MSQATSLPKEIKAPAWGYVFLKPGRPNRSYDAWVLLSGLALHLKPSLDNPKISYRNAVRVVSREMKISPRQVRNILNRGKDIFWDISWTRKNYGDGCITLRSWGDVWGLIENETEIAREETYPVPRDAFGNSIRLHAYLSAAVLSRGDKPCSLGYAASRIGRGYMYVWEKRKILKREGRLVTQQQWLTICGPQKFSGNLARLSREWVYADKTNGELMKKDGSIVKRLPDIVMMIDTEGHPFEFIPNPERWHPDVFECEAKIYYDSQEELLKWLAAGLPIADRPIIRNIQNPLDSDWQVIPHRELEGVLENGIYKGSIPTKLPTGNPQDQSIGTPKKVFSDFKRKKRYYRKS